MSKSILYAIASKPEGVGKLVRDLCRAGCDVKVTTRANMGWPCFYCGETLNACKDSAFTHGNRCCNQCNGSGSH